MKFSRELIDETIDKVCSSGDQPNTAQREAVHKIVNGSNMAIVGPPGTGKTFTSNLIDRVMCILRPTDTFSRTATTGMASTHIVTNGGDEGKTFYRWLNSGNESMLGHTPLFLHKIKTYTSCRRALSSTKVLQIDEASMLNEMVLQNIDCAAREVRKNRSCMGGIQVILTGDIHQLGTIDVSQGAGHQRDMPPIPIPSILDNLPKDYEVIILKEMVRTGDALHRAILKGIVALDKEVRRLAVDILNKRCCSEPIYPWNAVVIAELEGYTIVTYSNKQVDLYNDLERATFKQKYPDGPIHINDAVKLHTWDTLPREAKKNLQDEEGMKREEDEIIKRRSFVSSLSLYPNQSILLRRNQEHFKNGQTARFIEIVENDSGKFLKVVRHADGEELYIDVCTHTSEYYSQLGFEQYPLIPNAAVTTHKIQGSTLNKVLFDPTSLEFAGKDIARLLYTSASRTRDLDSFRLTTPIPLNFIMRDDVQEALEKLWSLDYMSEYPTISLTELRSVWDSTR